MGPDCKNLVFCMLFSEHTGGSEMNILIIGAGGREHSLAWKIAQSPKLGKLYCAPGNAGTANVAECINIDASEHDAVITFCRTHDISLVVIGPEMPLVAGLGDDLQAAGFKVFGPSKAAAQLEGSKRFTKDLCAANNIPTAAYACFKDAAPAKAYLQTRNNMPIVIKADGLAAGKGVVIANDITAAEAAVDNCFSGHFGKAGAEVVIEEYLDGEEASFFALCDGKTAVPLATAQDHKRAFTGDRGPNTGGMGAYSPAPIMSEEICQKVMSEIILPTIQAMDAAGTPYRGVLYAGLMITDRGPELIEYNVRFGDPECQVLMLRLKSDIVDMLATTADGNLDTVRPEWHENVALTVVMAANGYPGDYVKNTVIRGIEKAADMPDVEIFHAGTASIADEIVSIGGRVLNITAKANNIHTAQKLAYAAAEKIAWPDGFYRRDIGWRAVNKE
jgi:phosphoribosylamine--glycine ligase